MENNLGYDDLPPQHIRILYIVVHHDDDGHRTLQAQLFPFHVSTLPNYCALSYAWSRKESPTKSITCNGFHLSISEHLYSALVKLNVNETGGKTWVWADAICINQ
jgi:hypothetical protein